jgi:hypothetical protein
VVPTRQRFSSATEYAALRNELMNSCVELGREPARWVRVFRLVRTARPPESSPTNADNRLPQDGLSDRHGLIQYFGRTRLDPDQSAALTNDVDIHGLEQLSFAPRFGLPFA